MKSILKCVFNNVVAKSTMLGDSYSGLEGISEVIFLLQKRLYRTVKSRHEPLIIVLWHDFQILQHTEHQHLRTAMLH